MRTVYVRHGGFLSRLCGGECLNGQAIKHEFFLSRLCGGEY